MMALQHEPAGPHVYRGYARQGTIMETLTPEHPGSYVKREVLPPGMTVKDAASRMGIGRPALSNFLNERASLSTEMALRLEKTFGAKREVLVQMQAAYDEFETRERERDIAVRAYAPSLMDITATQIAAWSSKSSTRSLLPAFLRRLVQSTGANLSRVDFPAYDSAERPGWDGQVETDTATPWIPSGFSGWEFGCSEDPRQKAEKDYAARVVGVPVADRKSITFVFVTPRNWPGKNEWVKAKQIEKDWKEVRVLDASDLEQWLEQSVPAQSWMAEQLGIHSDGIASLDYCWDRWAKVTEPELSKELFSGSVEFHKNKLDDWLKEPPARPLIISADSKDEALAFLSCVFQAIGTPAGSLYDRAVVLESVDALKRATRASSNFIAIINSAEVESASAGLHKTQYTIIFRNRSAVENKPEVALDLLDDKTFKAALSDMGVKEDDLPRLERESGKSPTILRRRLSVVPEIRIPAWAQDKALARKLIPLGFAGVWNSATDADQQILSVLTNESSYEDIERSVATLLHAEQSPVWSVGRYRGVASKIDVLYATNRLVTLKELKDFFIAAHYVLCEKDPALDVPEEDRWAAHVYGKTRNHSADLREGICETLVLLAVHGNNLFQDRLGINVEAHVNKLVHDLLTPLNAETWASQQHDLPRYAEAAPDEFLDILESDLNSDDPQVLTLLRPAGTGVFQGCPRSGLLWALELLAWRPERLLRVASILARLSQHKIDDNWINKPENSLKAIFRAGMPQTAANTEQRIAVLEKLTGQYSDLGWRLCLDQFDSNSNFGHYSSRPRWRDDAAGAGQPIRSGREVYSFVRKALDIAIAWPNHNESTLGDLIQQLQGLDYEDQEKIWNLVQAWAASRQDEARRASLREHIRRFAFTRWGKRNVTGRAKDRAREIYELLEPKDPIVRHQWLFAEHWVEESQDEIADEDYDFRKRDEKIAKLRLDALLEVWSSAGYDGMRKLCESGNAAFVIGWHLADIIRNEEARDFLCRLACEPEEDSAARVENCMAGFLARLSDDALNSILSALIERFAKLSPDGDDKRIRLLRFAPFGRRTWQHVAKLPKELGARYWKEVHPQWRQQDRDELHTIIHRLLDVDRPRAALSTIHLHFKEIETESLIRLLKEVAINGAEPSGHYQLRSYEISDALKILDSRADASRDDLAHLEFLYLTALDRGEHGIPNLERQLAQSPALFMQAVGISYKRKGDGEDPPEWHVDSSVATQAYRLLHKARRIPGARDDGSIDLGKLKEWIAEVRALCKMYGREVVGDHSIGELLAKAPPGPDSIWPCEPVRQALEEIGTKDIADGIAIGVYNLRGAHWRGVGGQQERDLAAKYRGWSKQVAFDSPFVSRLLEQIARSYDRDAEWHDTDANIRKRLSY
jgi:addiction module HigA family antidote